MSTKLIVSAALEAGKIAMAYFRNETTDVWYKNGNSPVSQADHEIDRFLHQHLLQHKPDHGWLSEETEDNQARLENNRLFIVDPIDGTRGFIKGQSEWCISIAIVEQGKPVEGVLHCPALNRTIYASSGEGILVNGQKHGFDPSSPTRSRPLVTGSRKLIETITDLPDQPMDVSAFIPSLAYRLSLVATGELDGAFARPGASEWDIAAADIILQEAGCCLSDKKGNMLVYNKPEVRSPSLIAANLNRKQEILALANSTGILH
ncbi:MAG: 3'(2'),5'-bisphosphate nucleotidase CysQ [Rhizobiaceae bacterium]